MAALSGLRRRSIVLQADVAALAPVAAVAIGVAAVSQLEDVVEIFFRDAPAPVPDRHDRLSPGGIQRRLDPDRAARGRVADGVVEKVADDACHLGGRELDDR